MQAVKEKTEDGIFGTSGGIGFTKANELFVGRVAMFGFAVCVFVFSSRVTPFPFWHSPYSVFLSMHSGLGMAVLPCSFPFAEFVQNLAFNSWFWFAQASILGEALTGKGTLAQFDIETGIPLTETEPLLLFFILFTLLGAIGALGDRGKFVDDAPATGLDRAVIAPGKGVKSALGLNEKGKQIVWLHYHKNTSRWYHKETCDCLESNAIRLLVWCTSNLEAVNCWVAWWICHSFKL